MTLAATPRTEPMLPRPFEVTGRVLETEDTVTLQLHSPEAPLRYRPGQFTMLYAYGVGESAISISGDPGNPELLQHTIRKVGATTNALFDARPGDAVGVRGPFGTAWPTDRDDGSDLLVVAGGIGLAPLRPAILDALAHRDRFGSVSILYGARTPADLLFEEDLHAWRARFDVETEVTVDQPLRGWNGDVGVVTTLMRRVEFDPERTLALVCGPEVMMKIVARELAGIGVPADSVFLSIERNMKCAIGFCGHCQFGADFVCKDGPVMPYSAVARRLGIAEI